MKKKSNRGGKRAGAGSKPRIVAVGKTVTLRSSQAGIAEVKIVIGEVTDGKAYGVDDNGCVWTFESSFEDVPDTHPLLADTASLFEEALASVTEEEWQAAFTKASPTHGLPFEEDVEVLMKQMKDMAARLGTKED